MSGNVKVMSDNIKEIYHINGCNWGTSTVQQLHLAMSKTEAFELISLIAEAAQITTHDESVEVWMGCNVKIERYE